MKLATLGRLLAFGAWAQAVGAQEVPTFTAEVESVYVDVFVTRGGESVPGLTARNFELKDNGVRQDVSIVSLEEIPVRAVLVFDTSRSVTGEKFRHLRSAGRAFLNGLQQKDEVSLLSFSHRLRLRSASASDPRSLGGLLDRLSPSGSTSLFDALFAALELAEGAKGRPIIVVFTDGEDRLSWLGETEVEELARESSAVIYSVAVSETHGSINAPTASPFGGNQVGTLRQDERPRSELLHRLATITGGRAWDVASPSRLEKAFAEILGELETRYLLSYSPAGVDEPGWHELKVRVKGRKGKVRARRGYYR